MDLVPIPSQTAGPFFHLGLTATRSVPRIAGSGAKGERVWLACRVIDGDGNPVNDAMIETWQADAAGKYNHPDDNQEKTADPSWFGFGRAATARGRKLYLRDHQAGTRSWTGQYLAGATPDAGDFCSRHAEAALHQGLLRGRRSQQQGPCPRSCSARAPRDLARTTGFRGRGTLEVRHSSSR